MLRMRGMLRFELNNPLMFANVTEDSWDGIYRRAIVIDMKGQFPPKRRARVALGRRKNAGNISPKGDTLKNFLEARPAAAAFFNIIYAYMNNHTMEESRNTIDRYARKEGATWRITGEACYLPTKPPVRKRDKGSEIRDKGYEIRDK